MDDCVFCGMVLCDKGPVNGVAIATLEQGLLENLAGT